MNILFKLFYFIVFLNLFNKINYFFSSFFLNLYSNIFCLIIKLYYLLHVLILSSSSCHCRSTNSYTTSYSTCNITSN